MTELADKVLKSQIEILKDPKFNWAKSISQIVGIKDPEDDRACWGFSLRNRLLMVNQGSFDSRNSNEWKKNGRAPKVWQKTVRIIKPNMAYLCAKDKGFMYKSNGIYKCKICSMEIRGMALALKEKKCISFVRGYGIQPLFDVANTYDIAGMGKLKEYKPIQKPKLFALIKELGIDLKYQTDPSGSSYGHVSGSNNQMVLGTEDPTTFYHELVHKLDQKLNLGGKLKGGQDPQQEIVAELTASVLSEIYESENHIGFSFKYIAGYAEKQKITVDKAINKILPRVEKILNYCFEYAEKLNIAQKGIIVQ